MPRRELEYLRGHVSNTEVGTSLGRPLCAGAAASTDGRRQSRSAVSGASPGALDSDVYWPAQLCCVWPQDRLPTALRSPELSLASFKRQLKTHSSVPALDSAGCSCGCRVPSSHRRCCDYTASSAPTANVQTRFDSTPLFIRTRPVFAPAGCSHGDAGCRYHSCNNLLCTTTVWMFVVFLHLRLTVCK